MNINQWAIKWGISPQAMFELSQVTGVSARSELTMSESAVQQRVMLKTSQKGARLFRNNVGATKAVEYHTCPACETTFEVKKQPIRYGLCNESSKVNKKLKSSDLIGITPLIIEPQHVGQTVGIFTAYELKKSAWRFSGNEHEMAQQSFLLMIAALGGIAKFVNHEDQV